MADNDAAFLWETEALRSSTARPMPASVGSNGQTDEHDWVTLRQANEITGIPIKTIRKWARHEHIATYLDDSGVELLRMVSLSSVRDRASRMGRSEEKISYPAAETQQPPQPRPEGETLQTEPPAAEQPPGTMLVPIDAWDKMLLQLGNLHEAGQQLAEARERAAKAETESSFLKERLTEMRNELAETKSASLDPTPSREEESAPAVEVETIEEPTAEAEPMAETDEIVVHDLGATPEADDSAKSVGTYSLEVMKHVYSTWRGRPRR